MSHYVSPLFHYVSPLFHYVSPLFHTVSFSMFQAVGCDGVVGSGKVTDKCGVCNGGNNTCHIISGIFTRMSLPYGYNKVTTIPSGACNINITEMSPSKNYMGEYRVMLFVCLFVCVVAIHSSILL